jgi:hypothetical protein
MPPAALGCERELSLDSAAAEDLSATCRWMSVALPSTAPTQLAHIGRGRSRCGPYIQKYRVTIAS